jgi:hypothetical protein
MEKLEINKITVRAQTVNEEFDYLMNILRKMDFYNEHGYKNLIPDHPFFLKISNDLNLLNSSNIEKAKSILAEEIYNPSFFKNGLKIVNDITKQLEEVIQKVEKWKDWGFKIFPKYEIRLTAYGPGGSYNFNEGKITMKLKKDGTFSRIPQNVIVHEIIHIGIEESIIKKFELSHVEKEGLVDAICVNYFNDLLTDYRVQERGDKNIFNLVSKNNISELPKIIEEYKNK